MSATDFSRMSCTARARKTSPSAQSSALPWSMWLAPSNTPRKYEPPPNRFASGFTSAVTYIRVWWLSSTAVTIYSYLAGPAETIWSKNMTVKRPTRNFCRWCADSMAGADCVGFQGNAESGDLVLPGRQRCRPASSKTKMGPTPKPGNQKLLGADGLCRRPDSTAFSSCAVKVACARVGA